MKILHYTLGLPPYRSGGLTKYSYDLMIEQIRQGDEVYLLYPGHFSLYGDAKIKDNKKKDNISVYELINPLPVSLLGGVSNTNAFIAKKDIIIFQEFLQKISPDIVHLHTLMGLPQEFISSAKALNIKIVYTTHDYFGICPKVNLLNDQGNICNNYNNGYGCISCNQNSYGMKKIFIMQSRTYRTLKSNNTLRKVALKFKTNKKKLNNLEFNINKVNDPNLAMNYKKLRNYYIESLKLIDTFHFNSSISKNEYEKYLKCNGKVISITHKDIKDNRKANYIINNDKLVIGYLGKTDKYKGFHILMDSFKNLNGEKANNIRLDIYGDDGNISYKDKEVVFHGKYSYSDMKDIFSNIDILFAPSVWKETYGFIVLEAMSYGIPVVVTKYVGAKDLIKDGKTGFIIEPTVSSILEVIDKIIYNKDLLVEMNKTIKESELPLDFNKHVTKIKELYSV
jgi:glycosyltransferase involved in cell wall biosynthesis